MAATDSLAVGGASSRGGASGAALAMVLPAAALFAAFVLWPMCQTLWGALHEFGISSPGAAYVGLANLREIASDPLFWRAVGNNGVILVLSVAVQVGLGTILAALLDRGVKRGSTAFRTIIFAPTVMSTVAVSLVWSMIYHPIFGIAGRLARLLGSPLSTLGILGDASVAVYAIIGVACWQFTGFVTVIMLAGMQSIPEEVYEAARLDGAGPARSFVHVTLPGVSRVLAVATLLTMIGSFKIFDLVYVLTGGGPGDASQVLGTYIYKTGFTLNRMGYASALAAVLLAVALLLGIVQLTVGRRRA